MATCVRCDLPAVGQSKYCREHKAAAREAWKATVAASAAERETRVAGHRDLWDRASGAAAEAWRTCQPDPMLVTDQARGQAWIVSEGVCGFANVVVRPGGSSFARWLSKHGLARPHYYGGLSVSIYDLCADSRSSQSYDRKVAAARAAARVLNEGGVKASVDARLD